jgi:hypothetical protein
LTGSIQGHGALLNGLHFFSSSPEMLSSWKITKDVNRPSLHTKDNARSLPPSDPLSFDQWKSSAGLTDNIIWCKPHKLMSFSTNHYCHSVENQSILVNYVNKGFLYDAYMIPGLLTICQPTIGFDD